MVRGNVTALLSYGYILLSLKTKQTKKKQSDVFLHFYANHRNK